MAIKAIFFDAAGTLIETVRPVGETYACLATKHGLGVSPAEVGSRFRSCFASAPPLAFPRARPEEIPALEWDWWRSLVKNIFQPWGLFAQFDDYFFELFEYFSKPSSWKLHPEAAETLVALKKQRLILDIVSNFDSRLVGIMEGLGAARWFDRIFLSSHVGYAKPDREIFQFALNAHRLKTEEVIHVGDSKETDLQGAINAGLTGILLDPRGQNQRDGQLQIQNLKELLSILHL